MHDEPCTTTAAATAASLHEVAPGVHAWVQPDGTWWINNAGAVIGDEGVVIIDTCATEQRTRRFLDAVAAASSDAPIALAMNTHAHGDHTYGNSLLPSTTTLIGHPEMRQTLLDDPLIDGCPPAWEPVPDWGQVTRRVPDVTTTGGLTLHAAGRRIEIHHPGGVAHTSGDLVAWLPDERVLFSGDLLFHGLTPLAFQGSIDGARRSLEWLAAFGPETVVPGHGPLITSAALDQVIDDHERYYRLVLDAAAAGHRDGLTPLEAASACDLGAFAEWDDAERIVLNLHAAYAELDGVRIDLAAAILDAMTWNGGPLTTHVCCTG